MPRGQTASPYSLQERRRLAFDMFMKGYSNVEVAERLVVNPGTISQYREQYEEEIAHQLSANPQMLRNVLENTVRALAELDAARKAAWTEYEGSTHRLEVECPHCEHEFTAGTVSSPTTRNQILNTIIKAQEQRGKLLGLFGVKQEFLLHVQSVRILQEAILGFMRSELCAADKTKLERFILEHLGEHVERTTNMPTLAALETELIS